MSTIKRQCCREAAFFHAQEGPMFSGLRSDAMAVSHVWLGLPGRCFQCGGALQTAVGTLHAMWPKNLKRCSVTMLESGVTLTLP